MEQTKQLTSSLISKEEIIEYLAGYNHSYFNISKLEEELIELLEVCVKWRNKVEKYKPPMDKFIEEAGDVEVRLAVMKKMFNIEKEVEIRKSYKLGRLSKYMDNPDYKNRV